MIPEVLILPPHAGLARGEMARLRAESGRLILSFSTRYPIKYIAWRVFAIAGGLALVIALLTVSTQAIRAALANPVEALRYE